MARRQLAAIGAVAIAGALISLAACGATPPRDTTAESTNNAELPQSPSSQSRYEGGEESIEAFGSEATGSDREQILQAEQGYLQALAGNDYRSACSHLSTTTQRSLTQLAGKGSSLKGCPQILAQLLASSAAPIARRQASGTVTKVRVQGRRAFVIFHAPGAKLYLFTIAREGDGWKATTIAASILVPSAATLGAG